MSKDPGAARALPSPPSASSAAAAAAAQPSPRPAAASPSVSASTSGGSKPPAPPPAKPASAAGKASIFERLHISLKGRASAGGKVAQAAPAAAAASSPAAGGPAGGARPAQPPSASSIAHRPTAPGASAQPAQARAPQAGRLAAAAQRAEEAEEAAIERALSDNPPSAPPADRPSPATQQGSAPGPAPPSATRETPAKQPAPPPPQAKSSAPLAFKKKDAGAAAAAPTKPGASAAQASASQRSAPRPSLEGRPPVAGRPGFVRVASAASNPHTSSSLSPHPPNPALPTPPSQLQPPPPPQQQQQQKVHPPAPPKLKPSFRKINPTSPALAPTAPGGARAPPPATARFAQVAGRAPSVGQGDAPSLRAATGGLDAHGAGRPRTSLSPASGTTPVIKSSPLPQSTSVPAGNAARSLAHPSSSSSHPRPTEKLASSPTVAAQSPTSAAQTTKPTFGSDSPTMHGSGMMQSALVQRLHREKQAKLQATASATPAESDTPAGASTASLRSTPAVAAMRPPPPPSSSTPKNAAPGPAPSAPAPPSPAPPAFAPSQADSADDTPLAQAARRKSAPEAGQVDSDDAVPLAATARARGRKSALEEGEIGSDEDDVPLALAAQRHRRSGVVQSDGSEDDVPLARAAEHRSASKEESRTTSPHKEHAAVAAEPGQRKRSRALLSDSDSGVEANGGARPRSKKTAVGPAPASVLSSALAESTNSSSSAAAMQSTATTIAAVPPPPTVRPPPADAPIEIDSDDDDDDDVPLGAIIKSVSPMVSPQPPQRKVDAAGLGDAQPMDVDPPAAAPRKEAPSVADATASASASVVSPAAPAVARKATPSASPLSAQSPADTALQPHVAAGSTSFEPSTPLKASGSTPVQNSLVKIELASSPTAPSRAEGLILSDDDDIIFVSERPAGHKLVLPPCTSPKPPSPPAPPPPPALPREDVRALPAPATVSSPASSDPLNIPHAHGRGHGHGHDRRTRTPPGPGERSAAAAKKRKGSARGTSSSEEDGDASDAVGSKRRRSSRSRAQMAAEDEEDDNGEEEGSSDIEDGTESPQRAQANAIGLEDEIEEDELEDDENLRLHRGWCEKCEQEPADQLQEALSRKRNRGRKKRATSDDADVMSDGEEIAAMGGWMECRRCCVAAHFGCLAADQRATVLKELSQARGEKVHEVGIDEELSFLCGGCTKSPECFACGSAQMEELLGKAPVESKPNDSDRLADAAGQKEAMDVDVAPEEAVSPKPPSPKAQIAQQEVPGVDLPLLFFRCYRCKRGIHYCHLQAPRGMKHASEVSVGQYHQEAEWSCHDCLRWVFDVDKIIAWRPSPADAVEDPLPPGVPADYKKPLRREYLVKWSQLGFRHVEWVPHQWLLANSKQRLRNFLTSGSDLAGFLTQLSHAGDDSGEDSSVAQLLELEKASDFDPAADSIPTGTAIFTAVGPPAADPIADSRIPTAWKTIDRVLTVWMKRPHKRAFVKKGRGHRRTYDRDLDAKYSADLEPGIRPDDSLMVDTDEWQDLTGLDLDERAIEQVVWAYVKWEDLPYKLSTYDTPPSVDDKDAYAAFKRAWKTYTIGLKTIIPILTAREIKEREMKRKFQNIRTQPPSVVGGQLMDFQMQGLNWLYSQWCKGVSSILADDMGLGKTVQIAALVGVLTAKHYSPILIIVPNSTVSNWMREFQKWIPNVRAAPYHGEKASRDIVEDYELFHGEGAGGRDRMLKVHVVITTYEAVTHKSFNDVFRRVPRWEMLVADEGQRLKNDASKIVKSIATLNVAHRVLLTGTPLNNNIRELFNLMNFLDPDNWNNLDALTQEYESVTSDNLVALRERLKPYFLRRVKADVLKLPPKHEVIVPIFMRSLQREVYKALLMANADSIKNLVGNVRNHGQTGKQVNTAKARNASNLMMELRKACAHPYLNQEDMEDKNVAPDEMHKRLTEASAKLCFLKLLLPKLFQKGHRVLLFSNFVIALDILSDWLDGEGISFFRLDGNTQQAQRQKDIDAFNAPTASTNLFILSTRAGGVGINLATADTVIMFDADFNPHQDAQAIARAYRFGQKKKVLVFRLMIRNSVEETILERGKGKMVLDQLIIQDMAKEQDTDVGSLIAFGAKALFAEDDSAVKHYSSEDVDEIISHAETAEDVVEAAAGMKFDYAEIYDGSKNAGDKDGEDNNEADVDEDFWDAIVKRAAEEKAAKDEAGRGVRRAKKTSYVGLVGSPEKKDKGKGRENSPDFDPDASSEEEDDSDFEPMTRPRRPSPSVQSGADLDPAAQQPSSLKDASGQPKPSGAPPPPKPANASASSAGRQSKDKTEFQKMEQKLVKIARRLDVDLVQLLHSVHSPATAPARRRDLWDLAVNLLSAQLEVQGSVASLQLRPVLSKKALAYKYLDSLSNEGGQPTNPPPPQPPIASGPFSFGRA